jgi:hypothetical protein
MGGYVCQPSLSNAVKSMGIVLFHKASERILHLDDGLESSASNVISLTQIKAISHLESIRFVWDAFDQRWEGMFAKLENYRRQQGDCLVPINYKEDPSLGRWVYNICSRCDELDSDQISRLKSIGFIWNPFDQQWEEMFAKLEL